jgi:8-oxo-dGTP pyrophosphatase MutT (NUDIX family)
MASFGRDNYVAVVLPIRGSKAYGIKIVLQRERRTCRTWFPARSILHNESLIVDAAIRELLEE